MLVAAAIAAVWTTHWSDTTFGLPGPGALSAVRQDLADAVPLFQEVKPPAPVAAGFLVASAIAVWCIAYVADWAAFRLWVPFEATLPAGTLFLFASLLQWRLDKRKYARRKAVKARESSRRWQSGW